MRVADTGSTAAKPVFLEAKRRSLAPFQHPRVAPVNKKLTTMVLRTKLCKLLQITGGAHGFRSPHDRVLKGGFVNSVFRSIENRLRTCPSCIVKDDRVRKHSTGSQFGLLKVGHYENTVELPCPTDVAATIGESAREFDRE